MAVLIVLMPVRQVLELVAVLVALGGQLLFFFDVYYRVRRNMQSIEGAKRRIAEQQKGLERIERYLIKNTDYSKQTNETYEDY